MALWLPACAETSAVRRDPIVNRSIPSATLAAGLTSERAKATGSEGTSARRDVLGPYLDFLRAKQDELMKPGLSERDRRVRERALTEMWLRVAGQSESALASTNPARLYEGCWQIAASAEREAEGLARKREAKLDEYWQWASIHWGGTLPKYQRAGRAWLVTESPTREASLDALTRAVLDWAYTHTDDPAFFERSPSEIALYLLARRGALANVVQLGVRAHPHLDYSPDLDPSLYTPEQLATEVIIGFIPGVGEVVFAVEAVTGITVTGHTLETSDRVIIGLSVLLPFAPGIVAGFGGLERTALVTGRSLEEAEVLARMANQLSPGDVAEVERALRGLSEGRALSREEIAQLEQIARGLEAPVARIAEAVRQGGKSLLGSRLGADGARLVPGSAEHMAQCWIDYQFRNPNTFRRFSYAVDPKWQKLYRAILENKAAGGEFEQAVLKAQGYEKNTIMMMPPPGEEMQGFIPDAVLDNPTEFIWGKPYSFVEVKGRADMALTGNLKAMIEYVHKYGGHIEVWFRSEQHAAGATRLTSPLTKELRNLGGNAEIRFFPP